MKVSWGFGLDVYLHWVAHPKRLFEQLPGVRDRDPRRLEDDRAGGLPAGCHSRRLLAFASFDPARCRLVRETSDAHWRVTLSLDR